MDLYCSQCGGHHYVPETPLAWFNQPHTKETIYCCASNPSLSLKSGVKVSSATFTAKKAFEIWASNSSDHTAQLTLLLLDERSKKKGILSLTLYPKLNLVHRFPENSCTSQLYRIILCCCDTSECTTEVEIHGKINSFKRLAPHNITPEDKKLLGCQF